MHRLESTPVAADGRLKPAAALWHDAPTRAADGTAVGDFMLLMPQLRGASDATLQVLTGQLTTILTQFGDRVLFADLNFRLGVLWVSVQARPGLCAEVAEAVQSRLPGTRLVGNYCRSPRSRIGQVAKRVQAFLVSMR